MLLKYRKKSLMISLRGRKEQVIISLKDYLRPATLALGSMRKI